VANTLAYYDTATITAVKSFIVQAHGVKFFILKKEEAFRLGKNDTLYILSGLKLDQK
jgi:hypothetical protein